MLGTLNDRPMLSPLLRLAFPILFAPANVQTDNVPPFGRPTDPDDPHKVWIVFGHLLHERVDIQPVMECVVEGAFV